ncbi:MAG: HAMP domain-containing histidine kinase [Lachnospiraceae bacterium]|nr:HAMP domain-containing histidine kinase [Lachnospiraceae bacterium]
MGLLIFVISVLWFALIICFAGLKLQLRSLRRQLEYRISAPIKKPLALELQDNDLVALTAALNQIFKQDEEFRTIQNMHENEYKELITNISHDLRTPLTVLKGYLQLLERCETDDEGRKYLSVCFRHTDELERRIRQFFEYSYWMNQEQEPQLEILNITNIVADIMTDFIPMFEDKGLTMRLEQNTIYKGMAEEEMFRRVMQNLLKNCLQYSVGEVTVSITQDTDKPMSSLQNDVSKDKIRICVQNPIAEDSELDVSKIFQRFYVERKERNQSTGLGLSIVKLLVEKMQGEVFAIRDENLLYIGFYLRTSL